MAGLMAQMKRAARYVHNQEYMEQQLPFILGTWYYVVPGLGDDNRVGTSLQWALATVSKAYEKCTSGAGDGICVVSYGTSSAHTTTYLTASLDWSKNGITMFGVAAGGWFGRARIASDSTATALPELIVMSGYNNKMINIHMANYGTDAAALGCLKVTGNRNTFIGCHFVGAGHATPGAVAIDNDVGVAYGANDLVIGASELKFVDCIFGTNSVVRAGNNANIIYYAPSGQITFDHCTILSMSTTAGHGAIGLWTTNGTWGWTIFRDSTFVCWYENEVVENGTSLLIGSVAAQCGILLQNCGVVGWAALGATSGGVIFANNPAGAATGGVAVNPA